MQLSRAFWASRDFPLFAPDGKEGGSVGEGDPKAGTEGKEGKQENKDEFEGLELGDKGKAAIKAEREARKAAEDARKASDDELATLRKEKSEREAAETKRKEDEAKQKGEFEKLATDREKERDEAKAEVTRLTGEVDQLKAAMAEGIKAGWKELPEEVRKLGEKQHAEDDVLRRFQFLNDPDTKALVTKLTDKADPKRGNGQDPKSSAHGKTELTSLIGKASFLG